MTKYEMLYILDSTLSEEGREALIKKFEEIEKYNEENGIVPQTVKKDIRGIIEISSKDDEANQKRGKRMSKAEKEKLIEKLTREMKEAAKILDFEHAAFVRDRIEKLRNSK